jgi:hypothetical protein
VHKGASDAEALSGRGKEKNGRAKVSQKPHNGHEKRHLKPER